MSKKNTKTTMLEELNFDSGNSGMHLRVFRKKSTWDFNGKPYESIKFRAEVAHGAFGEDSVMSFPLGTPTMARYIANALLRTADAMEQENPEAWKYSPFDRLNDYSVYSVRNGLRRRRVFRVEMVTGPNSTLSEYLGIDWLDTSGKVVAFEKPERDGEESSGMGCSSEGGKSLYDDHEIGMTVRDVHAARKAANPNYTTYWTDREKRPDNDIRYVEPGIDPDISGCPTE